MYGLNEDAKGPVSNYNSNFKDRKKLNIAVFGGEQQSFLTRNMVNRFNEVGHIANVYNFRNSNYVNENIEFNAIVLFVDSSFLEDKPALVDINQFAMGKDIPVFMLGLPMDISAAEDIIPHDQIKGTYMRPIDINEVIDSIIKYLLFFKSKNKKTILVVDDSGPFLRNVKNMLDDKYQVMLATSALTAIKSITLHKPDLILMDYYMPIVNGMMAVSLMKNEKEFSEIPFMFLTSVDDADTVKEIMRLRPAAYLLKSMCPAEIISVVDKFFKNAGN